MSTGTSRERDRHLSMPPSLLHTLRRLPYGRYGKHALLWTPAIFFLTENVYSLHYVTGPSMSPTLSPMQTSPDVVCASRWNCRQNVKRGQVVLYRSPLDPETVAIKRVVGIEGDLIKTRAPYPEKFVEVRMGQVWVEGDEQFHSMDSNTYGAIPLALVSAKVTRILWPLGRAGEIKEDESKARYGALAKRGPLDMPKRVRNPYKEAMERSQF